MTTETSGAVLEDDGDDQLAAGAMSLFVSALVTCVVVAGPILGMAVGIEFYVLAGAIWLSGTSLWAYEVSN